jgi:hypothetical protein
MTGLQAELEAAFRKLPDDGKIPYEWLIPGIGRQLALMKPVDRKVATPDATKRKLVALKKRAKLLCGVIRGVAATYNRFNYATEKRAALDLWAAHVAGLAGSQMADSADSLTKAA